MISEDTARIIDDEVRILIEEAEATARKVLVKNLKQLKQLTEALLEYETLTGDEITALFKDGTPPDRSGNDKHKPKQLTTGASSIPNSRKPKGIGGTATQGV